MSMNLVIIIALVILLKNPPTTGTTKYASLDIRYLPHTVPIVAIDTGTEV